EVERGGLVLRTELLPADHHVHVATGFREGDSGVERRRQKEATVGAESECSHRTPGWTTNNADQGGRHGPCRTPWSQWMDIRDGQRAVKRSSDRHETPAHVAADLHIHPERVTGIEPALSAWEADVLPLNYTRAHLHRLAR